MCIVKTVCKVFNAYSDYYFYDIIIFLCNLSELV